MRIAKSCVLFLIIFIIPSMTCYAGEKVRLGVYNFAPLVFIQDDGSADGFFIDIVKHIAAKENWEIEYVSGTWHECLERLKNGEIDMLGSIVYSDKRAQYYDFTNEFLFLDWGRVYTKKGKNIETILDMQGLRVSVLKGSTYTRGFKDLINQFGIECTLVEKNEYTQVFKSVEVGEVDAGVNAQVLPIGDNHSIEATNIFFSPVKVRFATKSNKKKSLITTLDKYFSELKSDKQSIYYKYYDKWMHSPPRQYVPKWIYFVIVAALIVSISLLILNRTLNHIVSEKTKILKDEITERKMAEGKLQDSVSNLNEAVRAGRIGLWNRDLKRNKVSYSKEWKRQIGYEDHEIKDDFSEWENRVHPEDLQSTKAIIEKSIKEKNPEHRVEFRFRHRDGSYRWILSQGSLAIDEDGHPTNMMGSHIDITPIKKLEAELQQAQKMESIGTLAGGIAHDFNNILSAVLGYTELALGTVEKETPIADDLKEVYTAGLRAKDLVHQILTFARQSDEELKPIQVDFIIKEVLKFIRSSIPTTIEIKQNINSESLIMASSTQVHRIMMNLCTNAAHAMEDDGGILEIALKDITIDKAKMIGNSHLKRGNYIEIKVSDTGDGIDPHIIDKIFEPYFTTKGLGEGTGMGLAMVYGIVETYGGEIIVESKQAKGTVFTIYLPTAERENALLTYKSTELPTGQERILFVDDEVPIAKMASRILGQLGYSVTTKTNSLEALELFRSKPNDFDLVISDVAMPKMTGDQLTKKLIEIRRDIPIILCTGYSKRLSEKEAFDIGAKAFTYKPIVKEDLATTIREVLDDAKD